MKITMKELQAKGQQTQIHFTHYLSDTRLIHVSDLEQTRITDLSRILCHWWSSSWLLFLPRSGTNSQKCAENTTTQICVGSRIWSSLEIRTYQTCKQTTFLPFSFAALPHYLCPLYSMWAVSFSLSLSVCPLSQCADKARVVCWNSVLRRQAHSPESHGMPLKPCSDWGFITVRGLCPVSLLIVLCDSSNESESIHTGLRVTAIRIVILKPDSFLALEFFFSFTQTLASHL